MILAIPTTLERTDLPFTYSAGLIPPCFDLILITHSGHTKNPFRLNAS